jgi:hypothetical protein
MKRFRLLGPLPLNRYCTKRKPCTCWIPQFETGMASYITAFDRLNNLIPGTRYTVGPVNYGAIQ